MKKNFNNLEIFLIIFATCITLPVYANIIWPALIFSSAIWSTWFVIIISIIIEALILRQFIPHLTYLKALIISVVGNAASAGVGTLIMAIAMLGWHYLFDQIFGGTFNPVNNIVTVVVMFIGSCTIEYAVIRLIFGYRSKHLWIAILVGNFITYLLVMMYNYPQFRL